MRSEDKNFYGVFGLGISGLATINFLKKHNLPFVAWDDSEQNINFAKSECPNDTFIDITDPAWASVNILILSPGVPLFFPKPHSIVEKARKQKIEIICDIELFYRFFPNHTYIGITGTNGKSTTTALIGHILKENNISCKVVGNIGTPILSVIPEENDAIVIELSSYQLDLITSLRFNSALLLNITKDHIERHGSIDNYSIAKYRIFAKQNKEDFAIINIDHCLNQKLLEKLLQSLTSQIITISTNKNYKSSVYIGEDKLYYHDKSVGHIPQPNSLLGKHNQENIAAAYACINLLFGISANKIFSAISTFTGLPHRIQYIGKRNNITFVNDSKATNFESTENALKIFDNIYLIAGGISKEGGIRQIHLFKDKILKVFLVGKSQDEFALTLNEYGIPFHKSHNLDNAFNDAVKAAQISSEDSLVLLSPAAASLDQWKNFEERGNYFIKLAQKYLEKDA